MYQNWVSCYRIKPLFLVQELSKILRCRTQHALLLKVLDSSLWFLVEPVQIHRTHCSIAVSTEERLNFQSVQTNVQVNALLDDLFLLFEDLKLFWVVSA